MVGERTLTLRKPVTKKPIEETSPVYLPNAFVNGDHTNRCYILIGIPGSGKSHWVEAVVRNWRMSGQPTVICDDAFDSDLDAEEKKRQEADMLNAAIGVYRDIIIDRPNLTEMDRSDILLRLPEHYQKIAIVFTCPMNLIYERLYKRYEATGRPFSQMVVSNMLRRYERPAHLEFDRITNIDHTCRYM